MAIFNTNEFLCKTFSKTIFGTAALRPEAVCADGFTLSIQASSMHYCIPNEDLSDGDYSKVELGNLSETVEEFLPYAENEARPLFTVYGYVPIETLTPPTIEIVGFLGSAARFIAKPCLKQRVMWFPIIHYGCSA